MFSQPLKLSGWLRHGALSHRAPELRDQECYEESIWPIQNGEQRATQRNVIDEAPD